MNHKSIKKSKPDLAYINEETDVKVAIYLDGMSKNIHGNEERQRIDRVIRLAVEEEGFRIIDIAYSELDDPEIMKQHYRRISNALKG